MIYFCAKSMTCQFKGELLSVDGRGDIGGIMFVLNQ